jgi:Sugar (and other) transporter
VSALWILSYDWRYELYDGYEFRPWRLLLLVYAAPGIFGGFWLYKFPESPKFLLSQNRQDEALEVVQWMHRRNKGKQCHNDSWIGKLKTEASSAEGKNYKGA